MSHSEASQPPSSLVPFPAHKSEHQDRQPGDSVKGLEHRRGTVRDTSSFVSPETAVTRRTMLIGEKRSPTRQVSLHTLLGKQPRLLARETASAGHCGGHCHQSPFQAGLWSTSVPSGHHAPLTRGKFTVLRRGSQHRGTNKSFDNKAVSGSRKAKRGGISRVL